MTAMFPDSGVPAGDARNSIDVNTVAGCPELWYSTSRCEPRFDPAAANALLSEVFNVLAAGEVQYDCASLDHLSRAVRYIVQRGIPSSTVLYDGPLNYNGYLSPTATRYNDLMTLVFFPVLDNQGPVTINIDTKGPIPLLRNDANNLQPGDIKQYRPFIATYWNGIWFHVGLCASQVPIVPLGAVDVWVRPDGSDITGDGSANDPSKAFRTVQGAWYRVGSRYAITPLLNIRFRLGIPGTYQGSIVGPFGGLMEIIGDTGNPGGYRFTSVDVENNNHTSIGVIRTRATLRGITLVRDIGDAGHTMIALQADSAALVFLDYVNFDNAVGNPLGDFFWANNASVIRTLAGNYVFNGRGLALGHVGLITTSSSFQGNYYKFNTATHQYLDCHCSDATYVIDSLGVLDYEGSVSISGPGCTGKRYAISNNSIVKLHGLTLPGDAAGIISTGGQFTA